MNLPEPVLYMYLEYMQQLDAEEALHDSTVIAVANGNMKKHDLRRTTGRWQRLARGKKPRRNKAKSLDEIRALGIGVVEEGNG